MAGKKNGNARFRLTPKIHATVVELVRAGAFKSHAAAAAGVHPNTVESWIKKGKQEGAEKKYADFARDIAAAQAGHTINNVKAITQAAAGIKPVVEFDKEGNPHIVSAGVAPDWKAAAWDLERKHPLNYSTNGIVKREVGLVMECVKQVVTEEQYEVIVRMLADSR